METSFTPIASLLGGVMIGLAALLLLWLNGKVAGISGIVGTALTDFGAASRWRWSFIVGLLAGGGIALYQWVGVSEIALRASIPVLIVAGLLVGYGTRLGSGCTSGHGVCGIGRLSPRSIVATCVFMGVAFATVFVQRHLLGG
ncbi:YeeE/YedE family protein [Litorivivens sp.]|uniref:YeeE/YedE family protein n=1 Tax=Litorivivens sp. TaxID=2020868 RepID=UPI003569C70E